MRVTEDDAQRCPGIARGPASALSPMMAAPMMAAPMMAAPMMAAVPYVNLPYGTFKLSTACRPRRSMLVGAVTPAVVSFAFGISTWGLADTSFGSG